MITVTGSLAFDYIMDYQGVFSDHIVPHKIHQINLSFLVNTLQKQNGGTAGNIAYNLALLGTPVSIVGAAGSDFVEYGKFLQESGVDISNIKIVESLSTSAAYIMTDKVDNQITAFYPGAMSENSNLSLMNSPSRSQGPPGRWSADLVVIAPNDPKAMVKFTMECQKSNTPYMLDPGMQLPALSNEDLRSMIRGAFILIGNDYEIALLKEKTDLNEEQLLNQVKILITTLGEEGSIIQSKDNTPGRSQGPPSRWEIKAGKPNQVVDPTGAGDAYRAGFLAGLSKGLDFQVCGQMGSVTACYAVEKYGTTSHTFSLAEFKARYKENFGEELLKFV